MKPLIAYVILIFVGLIAEHFAHDTLWKVFNIFDTSSAVALAILAFFGYLEFVKSEQPIKIYFDMDGKSIDTGLSILRKNFTRGELMGILGMIQRDSRSRFEIESLKEISFLKKLQEIQTKSEKEFHIAVTEQELAQFTL